MDNLLKINEDLTGFENLSGLKFALRHYQSCDTLISKVRQSIITESDKIALGERASEVYKGAVNVCINLSESSSSRQIGASSDRVSYYNEQAFYFSEKNKSSVLLEALAGAEAQKFAGIPDTLLNKEQLITYMQYDSINFIPDYFNNNLSNQRKTGKT